jgi:hypothetical protein
LALVALFDCAKEIFRTRTSRAFLSSVAERGRLEFSAQPDEEADNGPPGGCRLSYQLGADLGEMALRTSMEIEDRNLGVSQWGINE